MVFSSNIFLFLFLPAVLFCYYILLRKRTWRNNFLLLASLGFYAWGEPWFVFVMILSILGNWGFGLLIEWGKDRRAWAKTVLILALVFNISILFIFKYLMFTIQTINTLWGTDFFVPQIVLPIGISFFTFQALSYVIDVYRGTAKKEGENSLMRAQRNPLNVGLYIALFPQLIAGPIIRYSTIAGQITNRHETLDGFSSGVCRFIFGLAKKAVIANSLAILADQIFAEPAENLTVLTAWLGGLAYTFQIYFDFSGYSDMAIGLGRMFGFHFLENFNYPYISRSISDFWRRWHISLGTWFRDYVYFPLGGSRVAAKGRLGFNLFAVWLLTGIWHGANWTFILWGLLFFVCIVLEKMTGYEQYWNGICGKMFKWMFTFVLILCGWVMFRSENTAQAWKLYQIMFGFSGLPVMDQGTVFYFKENNVLLGISALFAAPFYPWLKVKFSHTKIFQLAYVPVMAVLMILSLCFVAISTYNPFIYFNF